MHLRHVEWRLPVPHGPVVAIAEAAEEALGQGQRLHIPQAGADGLIEPPQLCARRRVAEDVHDRGDTARMAQAISGLDGEGPGPPTAGGGAGGIPGSWTGSLMMSVPWHAACRR